jgi:hypothetical protein
MPTSFWRSGEAQEQLSRLNRSGFAVDFLRRNPAYRIDCEQTQRLIAQGKIDEETGQAELARRWGLFCRMEPGCACKP